MNKRLREEEMKTFSMERFGQVLAINLDAGFSPFTSFALIPLQKYPKYYKVYIHSYGYGDLIGFAQGNERNFDEFQDWVYGSKFIRWNYYYRKTSLELINDQGETFLIKHYDGIGFDLFIEYTDELDYGFLVRGIKL